VKLTVTRFIFSPNSTIGILDADGRFLCYTLEPATPIPAGTYRLALLPSAKFQTYTPHVLDVPGHTAIEIHPGNSPKDTTDCTLVGKTRAEDWVGNSDEAFNELIAKLDASQDMQIEYREERSLSA